MTAKEQRKAAEDFAAKWLGRGYEKGECQKFWRGLLHDVFDVADPDDWVQYEVPVATGYVDAYISRTKVLIEQKGFGHGLADRAAMKQAMMYVGAMPDTMPVRYVVLSNFQEFWIYDKHAPEMKPVKVVLRDRLAQLFRLLNTEYADRDPEDIPDLLDFPYVGSGLFDDESIRIPRFTEERRAAPGLPVRLISSAPWSRSNAFGKHGVHRARRRDAVSSRSTGRRAFRASLCSPKALGSAETAQCPLAYPFGTASMF